MNILYLGTKHWIIASIKGKNTDMLCQDKNVSLNYFNDSLVKLSILASPVDGTGKIDFLIHFCHLTIGSPQ